MSRRNRRKLEAAIKDAKTRKEKALAYYNLGLFHDNNNREAEAIPNYKSALRFGLTQNVKTSTLAWLASSLYKTGRCTEALRLLKQSYRDADDDLKKFLAGLERRIHRACPKLK